MARSDDDLFAAIAACSPDAVRDALDDGADPDHRLPDPSGPLQPDTPLKLLLFRISDSLLSDDDLRACARIAHRLVAAGAERTEALQLAEARYGPYDPDSTGPFAEVWHVVARGDG